MEKATLIKALFAALATWLSYLVGGWDQAVEILVIVIALDYVTGVMAAWCRKDLNSYVGLKGIAKKVGMLILVTLAHQVDSLTGTNGVVRTAVIWFLIANDGLSILENLAETGLGIPDVLKQALAALKERK